MLSSIDEFFSRGFMPNMLLKRLPVLTLEIARLDLVE
jgi:hypothetical protein